MSDTKPQIQKAQKIPTMVSAIKTTKEKENKQIKNTKTPRHINFRLQKKNLKQRKSTKEQL
jgi:hypothetical protein